MMVSLNDIARCTSEAVLAMVNGSWVAKIKGTKMKRGENQRETKFEGTKVYQITTFVNNSID